jgi:hypothetical protein
VIALRKNRPRIRPLMGGIEIPDGAMLRKDCDFDRKKQPKNGFLSRCSESPIFPALVHPRRHLDHLAAGQDRFAESGPFRAG